MQNVVTVQNVREIDFTALVDLLREIYTREIPEVAVNKPIELPKIEHLMIFFSNQYSYMTELWAVMAHEVRLLKRTSANKEVVEEAVGKRDYLLEIMKATKIKTYCTQQLLRYHGAD